VQPRRPSSLKCWWLEAKDTFDRDSRPLVEASGKDLLEGIQLLWSRTLNDGLLDSGDASFTAFRLCWEDEGGADSTCLGVHPFGNRELALLKGWVGYHDGTKATAVDPLGLLPLLARCHASLLAGNPRFTGGWEESSEAKTILRLVRASADAKQLREALESLG
jgi:hypothetical protein